MTSVFLATFCKAFRALYPLSIVSIIPFLFLYILLLFRTDKRGRKHFVRYTILIIAILAIVYYLIMSVEVLYEAIGVRMEGLINGVAGEGEQDASSAVRDLYREIGIKQWIKRPLHGYGFASFKYYALAIAGNFHYSHCNYVELLYNGGIIYFSIYYFIYIVIFKQSFNRNNIAARPYRAFAVAVCISLLVFDYGAVTYEMIPIQLCLALAYKASTFKEQQNQKLEI